MSKRLQVLLDPAELRDIQRLAKLKQVTVAEWVRTALRQARDAEPRTTAASKRAVLRSATRHAFPSPDIDQMLEEIERGYREPTS